MKKLFYLLLIPFLFNCQGTNDKMKTLQEKNDSLISINNQKDKEINDFVMSLNQIQENLELIKETEKMVTLNAKGDIENKQDAKDKIQSDIQLIYQLMQNNKKTISELSRKLKTANFNITEFSKTIDFLNKKISDDSINISNLRAELEKKNIVITELENTVDTLVAAGNTKNRKIEEQTEKLNTAYYVVGTEKELKTHKILTKEGGFIGLGKNRTILNNFDKSYFTKIDLTKISKIKLDCKKATLITKHPTSSFKFEKTGKTIDNMLITDEDEFWSVSRYLVIMIEK